MIEKYPADIRAWIEARGGVKKMPLVGYWFCMRRTYGRWAIAAATTDRSRAATMDADIPAVRSPRHNKLLALAALLALLWAGTAVGQEGEAPPEVLAALKKRFPQIDELEGYFCDRRECSVSVYTPDSIWLCDFTIKPVKIRRCRRRHA